MAKTVPISTGSLCDRCHAKCCRYYALEIDTPESLDEFEDLRWYMTHGNTVIYVEDETWHLHIENRCEHLNDQFRCMIYEKRPTICRKHKPVDCEFSEPWAYDLKFTCLEELELYIQARYGKTRYGR
ncbi:MAG: YkgJ family cysteine cluster protein [Planctomycetota bacterium]|jgi:Fe-S-cluster containining protein